MLINKMTFKTALVLTAAMATFASASNVFASSIAGHTRVAVTRKKDHGLANPNKMLSIRLWIKRQDASNRPLADDAKQVKKYLESKGVKQITVDPHSTYVSAKISVALVQELFHVELRQYIVDGKPVIANTTDPQLDSAIESKVLYVGGLTTLTKKPLFTRQRDLDTGKTIEARPFQAGTAIGSHEINCFRGAETHEFVTAVASPGPSPAPSPSPQPAAGAAAPAASPTPGPADVVYTGNRYGADANAKAPALPPCGYDPAVVQKVYGITDLVKAGYDGTGQTIVIVDAYGSPTAQSDLAAFSAASGLPAPNLTVVSPGAPPILGTWSAEQQGWAGETTLDIEWAHVVAPAAKLVLVEATSSSDDDLDAAIAYAVDNNLGSVISNSWGGPESQEDKASIALFETLMKVAAGEGIAVNVSSGDSGDYIGDGQGGGLGYIDVSYPASSTLVTSVGGVSLALNSDLSIKWQSGWGTNGMRLTDGAATADLSVANANPPLDPPTQLGFIGGAGGGTSRMFPKPSFQSQLPGTHRLVPDIAFLADPYTGVEVIESSFDANGKPQPGTLTTQTIGGTSLAAPMFSALWAIANQVHGSNLGQAAPLLYKLPAGAITDIVPLESDTNVTGVLRDTTGTSAIPAVALALPKTDQPFYSALYNSPTSPFRWDVITFGTDSSLTTAVGWDNVTGLGVPNGMQFIQQFLPAGK